VSKSTGHELGGIAAANDAARAAALQAGACLLRECVTPLQVWLDVRQGPNWRQVSATWAWPGIVRVRLSSGTLLAQSLPGRPFTLDAIATAQGPRFEPHSEFTCAEAAAALKAAALVLRERQRLPCRHLVVAAGGRSILGLAVWHWPGLVRVTDRRDGQTVAQSLPGEPFQSDWTLRQPQQSTGHQPCAACESVAEPS
jgi:hypothetical protein